MMQHYASITLFQYTFFISSFCTGAIGNSNATLKSPQANSLLDGGFFTAINKGLTETTIYTFVKTQTAFVNNYLDFALSSGGGGGGGDDDWVVDYFALPVISGNYTITKKITPYKYIP